MKNKEYRHHSLKKMAVKVKSLLKKNFELSMVSRVYNPRLRGIIQEDHDLMASLGYTRSSRTAGATYLDLVAVTKQGKTFKIKGGHS